MRNYLAVFLWVQLLKAFYYLRYLGVPQSWSFWILGGAAAISQTTGEPGEWLTIHEQSSRGRAWAARWKRAEDWVKAQLRDE